MIEISSQMREFVNFAQDAVANDSKNSIARLGAKPSRYSAFSIAAADDGDSVGKLRRHSASRKANNTVRAEFRKTVEQIFGGADRIPEKVRVAMRLKDYGNGKPLTADRILDVYSAIKAHIDGLKNAALKDGTLRAVDVADSMADRFLEKFKAGCRPPPGAAAISNLKKALLLCNANMLDDEAVKGGEAAVRKFVRAINSAFNDTFKAFWFDTAEYNAGVRRVEAFMKDELHMRGAVFALLDKDGNVDAENFGKRTAIFDEAWLQRYAPALLRANIESPGPAAVKALQAEFVRTAVQKVGNVAHDEVKAYFKANPGKIPAAIRDDERAVTGYVQLVQKFVAGSDTGAGPRLAYGDADAKIDVASALRDFNAFMDSVYAAAKGDKELLSLVERFAGNIAFSSTSELRSVEDIKAKFIEPVSANLEELRSAAGGSEAILKAGVDALAQSEMAPFKKGVFTKLANGAKSMDRAALDSLSERSEPIEIAKAFTGMYAQFKKSMSVADYNDPLSRVERNACTSFFAGVAMSMLDGDVKMRMVAVFATKAASQASNIMQQLVTASSGMSQIEITDMQETVQMMRKCSTFIADDLGVDADAFAVNIVDEEMTADSIPDGVAAQFSALMKGIQE